MANNSDFTKPQHNIFEMLPEVYRSDVNRSVLNTTFNKFLSKDDTQQIVGTIGKPSRDSALDVTIPERTIHRQGTQLQPLIHTKTGTIDKIMSEADVLKRLQLLGVDISRFDEWGSATQFNYAPPINLDKLINYRNYYWVDAANPFSAPQYFVIKSDCSVAESRISQRRADLSAIVLPIVIDSIKLVGTTPTIYVVGDYEKFLLVGSVIDIVDSVINTGAFTILTTTFDGINTLVTTEEVLTITSSDPGAIAFDTQLFNLEVEGNYVCTGVRGWDLGGWDDNDYVDGTPPPGIWDLSSSPAILVPYEDDRTFNNVWDSDVELAQSNPWQKENFWLHINDITPAMLSTATQAQVPIIEYINTIPLNKYTKVVHKWLHRTAISSAWVETYVQPTIEEMFMSTPLDPQDVVGRLTIRPEFLTLWCYMGIESIIPTAPETFDLMDTYNVVLSDYTGDINFKLIRSDEETLPGGAVSHYDFTLPTLSIYPLAGSDAIAVYVNEDRIYGGFEEITTTNLAIDSTRVDVEYVTGIRFDAPMSSTNNVSILVSPVSEADLYKNLALVRTEQSDVLFNRVVTIAEDGLTYSVNPGSNISTVCEEVSLLSIKIVEQTKIVGINTYPQFDLYDIDGTPLELISPLFTFDESPTSPISPSVNKRLNIDTSNGTNNYQFKTHLISEDDGQLFCYIDTSSVSGSNPQGLQSIWRTSPTGFTYVPQLIDSKGRADGESFINVNGVAEIAEVDETNGDWEIVDQLWFNPHHSTRQILKFNELVTHFQQILAAQDRITQFASSDSENARLLYDLDYGLGGTIKEYNGSFDRLISSLFAEISDPIRVLEFADNAYASAISYFIEYVRQNLTELLLNDSAAYMYDQPAAIADFIISQISFNDNRDLIFGDSNTYNSTTGRGIQNFVATMPFLKLALAAFPYELYDEKRSISEVRCHDGHSHTVFISQDSIKASITALINTMITPTRKRGWTIGAAADGDNNSSPAITSYTNIPASRLLTNDYWVDADGVTLYRFEAIVASSSPIAPADGSFWLNSVNNILYVKTSSGGSPLTPDWEIAPGGLESAWTPIVVHDLARDVLLSAEMELYEAVPSSDLAWSVSDYITSPTDQVLFDTYMQEYFEEFIIERNILNPLTHAYDVADPWTWNYAELNLSAPQVSMPYVGAAELWAGSWNQIFENIYNTPYPHLEPWMLQGYTSKPLWWETEYAGVGRRWTTTMWNNIKAGTIPGSYDLPNVASIPQYSFVSVNITDLATTDGYKPDDLLPIFWIPPTANANDQALKFEVFIRSFLPLISLDRSADYVYGDGGPSELAWKRSTSYNYDMLKASFRLQPMRFMHHTWGISYDTVGYLEVDQFTKQVKSHSREIFHGDIIDDVPYSSSGINQWYVNFNRYNNFDNKTSDFRHLWSNWDTKYSYMFDAFIDPKSLTVTSTALNTLIENTEYSVLVKREPAMNQDWVGALNVTVVSYGATKRRNGIKVPQGDGSDWEFAITASSPRPVSLKRFGVRNVPVTITDPSIGLFAASESIEYYSTGDQITFSAKELPSELSSSTQYYIIRTNSPTQFYIATSNLNALIGLAITFVNLNDVTQMYMQQRLSTFKSLTGAKTSVDWSHHVLTESIISEPFVTRITGIQGVIDFVDGYAAYLKTQNFGFNLSDARDVDPDSGRLVTWSLEIERFIDMVYTGLGINNVASVSKGTVYDYDVELSTNSIILTNPPSSPYATGDEVYVFANAQTPSGLALNTPYYIITTSVNGKYKLATTAANARNGISITLTSTGSGPQLIGSFDYGTIASQRVHEINPFRSNLWYSTESGVVSNLATGPYSDYRTIQVAYDQYYRPISTNNLRVFREDKLTRIAVTSRPNDVSVALTTDPYQQIHLSGAYIFVDGYEHVLMLNSSTNDGLLIYDSFLGLSFTQFYLRFNRQTTRNSRTSVGGFYKHKGELIRNLEASVQDIQSFYDAYNVNDTTQYLQYARDLLGYSNPTYLDMLNASDTTKFNFWRGMIQHKGSKDAITSFINSRQLVDATLDEYWAYKVAEYGDNRTNDVIGIRLKTSDVVINDIRFSFNDTIPTRAFRKISLDEYDRWVDYPIVRNSIPAEYDTIQFNAVINNTIDIDDITQELYITTIVDNSSSPPISTRYINLPQHGSSVSMQADGVTLVAQRDYVMINSDVIKLDGSITTNNIMVVQYAPAIDNWTPCSIKDYISNTKVASLQSFDPAIGRFIGEPLSVVSIQQDYNPRYSKITNHADVARFVEKTNAWTDDYVGTTWLNTSKLNYVPYYDEVVNDRADDALSNWGKLSDWGSVDVYEWVKSSVPPSEYGALVAVEESDITLSNDIKASGVPVKTFTYNGEPIQSDTYTHQNFYGYERNSTVPPSVLDPIKATLLQDGLVKLYVNGQYQYITKWEYVNPFTFKPSDRITLVPVMYVAVLASHNILLTSTKVGGDFTTLDSATMYKLDLLIDGVEHTIVVQGSDTYGGLVTNLNVAFSTANMPVVCTLGNSAIDVTVTTDVYVSFEIVETSGELLQAIPDFVSMGTAVGFLNDASTLRAGLVEDYDYVAVTSLNSNNVDSTAYYFWVKSRAVRTQNRSLSCLEAESQLTTPSSPYIIFRGVVPTTNSGYKFTQVVLRGVASIVADDKRYSIQMVRDYTLRDKCTTGLSLKNVHTEWKLFRQRQNEPIPAVLWNKLTEALIGFKIEGMQQAIPTYNIVPSIELSTYDELNGTSIRFGLREGQTFIDRDRGLATIHNIIWDHEFDSFPIDKTSFLTEYNFDDPVNILNTMTYIYNTFPISVVNEMFFILLHDALSDNLEYPDIFKTSMISLYTIAPLEVAR